MTNPPALRRVTVRPTIVTYLASSSAPNPTYLVTEKFGFLFLEINGFVFRQPL